MTEHAPSRLWFRFLLPDGAFGPGKAELLAHIAETGSISAAGRKMEMSYRRAWSLVAEVNAQFGEPLVSAERGGQSGGGAKLTPRGAEVLETWRGAERALSAAAEPWLARLAPPTDGAPAVD